MDAPRMEADALPPALAAFLDRFLAAIRHTRVDDLRACFADGCTFTFDYTSLGKGVRHQGLEEAMEKAASQFPRLRIMESERVSHHADKGLHTVVLFCRDTYTRADGETASLEYDQYMLIDEQDQAFHIVRLVCSYRPQA